MTERSLAALPEVSLAGCSLAVADLHLDPFDEAACGEFAAWTRELEAQRLLVLGDLFDAWVGPAHESARGSRIVIEAFRRLVRAGHELLVLQGNRDFLLGPSFARASGARVFPDGLVGLLEGGERVLFLHGDELCTRDRAYQRLRRLTHSRLVQSLGPRLPLFLSRPIARRLRRASQRAVSLKPSAEKAIQPAAAQTQASTRGCAVLVCGHAHQARDETLADGRRWLILDAFGGRRDALRIVGAQLELCASAARSQPGGARDAGARARIPAMIIAIDGPAGAGKSTIARRLGQELGIFFLDSGAMYRSVAAVALRQGVAPEDAAGLRRIAESIELTFDEDGRIRIDGRAADEEIRTAEVDAIVSIVAAVPEVRAALVPKQKLVARRRGSLVAEGRDMTTTVFPEADFRFYLDASADERARRRTAQKGAPEREAEIRRGIAERDRIDSTRQSSPLKLVPGVVRVDTDGLSVEQVVEQLLDIVREASER
jgi:cytidylate kinase/UDP-2,3-diacylglucosamine diphosphatase